MVEKWSLSENYSVPMEEWQIDAGCRKQPCLITQTDSRSAGGEHDDPLQHFRLEIAIGPWSTGSQSRT